MFSFFKSQEEKQAKRLAKAIKKAYEPQKCCNNPVKSRQIAHELAADSETSAKYVPVRDVIKIFQHGDLELAVDLFNRYRKDPIIHRAKNLLTVLFSACDKEDKNFEQVADTMNWLKILMLVMVVKTICINSGPLEAKNYLYQEISMTDNIAPKDLLEVPKIIRYIAESELYSAIDVKTVLPYFLKIFKPLSTNPCDRIEFNVEDLIHRFPVDIVKDSSGKLSIDKTVGINDRLDPALMEIAFKNRMELTAEINDLDDSISQSQIQNLEELPAEDLRYYLAFKKVWQLKAEGMCLKDILGQLQQEGCALAPKSVRIAYEMHRRSSVISEYSESEDEFSDVISHEDMDFESDITGEAELA